jgi:phosphatidylglycerol lysyltransferase
MSDSQASFWTRVLPGLATASIFAVAVYALRTVLGELSVADVAAAMREIPPGALLLAILFTAASYLVLVGYDLLALRQIGRRLPLHRTAITSFIAYAIGHNVGVVALSAGAIRYRMYSLAGLTGAEITQVIAFCAVTFDLGAAALIGVSLIGEAGQAGSLLHASSSVATALGALTLAALAAYVALTIWRRDPIRIRKWSIRLPSWQMTFAQVVVSALDLVVAAAALYVLLPDDSGLSFVAFAGLYMVAIVVGALSTVPGGLGVFESVLLVLVPGLPADQLLGVLVAYRLVYYVLPFLIALLILAGHETWQQRRRVRTAWRWTRKSLDFVVPQAMALLVFLAGLVLLISGATPGIVSRIGALQARIGLSVLEISHLAGSAIGVGLLILARGLYFRLGAAWLLTVWLLGGGMAASLLKGLDWEEALALGLVLVPLLLTRREFYRRASLVTEPLSWQWLVAVGMAIGASIVVGVIAHQEVPYQNELWWQFAFDASAPRMMRASLVSVLGLGILATLRLMRPSRRPAPPPSAGELAEAAAIVQKSNSITANLALLGDKTLLFSASRRGFVMYGVSRRSWIALGDPVGPPEERADLVWQFRELCDREGGRCAFYEVAGENLPLYVDADLSLSKLGEEARVNLATFTLDGRPRAPLRQSHRKAEREGAGFRMVFPSELPALLPKLRAVSDDWLRAKSAAEKGFSLGFFDEGYLRHFPCAVVEKAGEIVAFANVWETISREECSIDLMRYSHAAPKSVMDYLFVCLMLWAQNRGYEWFNLGMAPLAGLEDHRLAPAWHKLGRLLYRYGENFYNFEGLRHYKDKFLPEWRPRYLAAPSGLSLPGVLLDVTTLISGGLRESVTRAPRSTDLAPAAS